MTGHGLTDCPRTSWCLEECSGACEAGGQEYEAFLATKRREWIGSPVSVVDAFPAEALFPFQNALTRWALRKGRAAIFADTGLGKTRMQLAWASQIPGRVLILAPLAVATQTIAEGVRIGVAVDRLGEGGDGAGIEITNYEQLHHITPARYTGVVLDESSILKAFDGKTRGRLIAAFADTPHRLCCTATPAPNDIAELANHCEFLGIMTRVEMLATFFVHDEDGWRLKGHAHDAFYRWLASWGMFVRRPSDLGFDDAGYLLPPLRMHEHVAGDTVASGEYLFADMGLGGIRGRISARRSSLTDRSVFAAEFVLKDLRTWTSPQNVAAPGVALIRNPKNPSSRRRHAVGVHDTRTSGESGTTGDMASALPNTTSSSPSKAKRAPSVVASRPGPGRVDDSTLIMTTPPEPFEGFSASPATVGSDSSMTTPRFCTPPAPTSSAQWVIWCGLNQEQDAVAKLLGDLCVSIQGSTPPAEKIRLHSLWISGAVPVLVTKPSVFGWGMNWQHCQRMLFLGIGDSFETYYQAIRRCWRFGQARPVDVHLVVSPAERAIVANVQRKERDALVMAEGLLDAVRAIEREEIGVTTRERADISTDVATGEAWTLHRGDSVEWLRTVPEASVDLSVYSPPFLALYTYTNSERDLGNCATREEFLAHYAFIVESMWRVTKPGRLSAVHIAQPSTTKATHGVIGLSNLRGAVIDLHVAKGWVYHGDVVIDKDPQAQAIRTHSKALLFVQLRKDASWLRPALADYIVVFRKPGENPVPIHPDISNEDWIEWARPIWYGIRESDTLNVRAARADDDDRHVCPLQLGTIERCVRLWSNPGETVLSPFAGIGSEGYESVRLGRRFLGCELKREYWEAARTNLRAVESSVLAQGLLFGAGSESEPA